MRRTIEGIILMILTFSLIGFMVFMVEKFPFERPKCIPIFRVERRLGFDDIYNTHEEAKRYSGEHIIRPDCRYYQ